MTDDDDAPIEDALAAARPREAPGLELARANVAGRLFGDAAPAFGRFRVLERLGGGGMGVVYAAYDPQLDRGVALKTVHVPSGSRELALREAKTLAKLSHPHIVPVFDVGLEQDQVYIVMELVRGATLRAWAKDRPPGEVIDVYRQAAEALAAAHDAGLVHRDFKPDNAIVGADGRLRVVDFGLAAQARAEVSAAGTPAYMAPEQAAGAAPTPAADQYSWCASLAEALGEPRPAWIAAIIARGCATDPAARFGSMRDVVRELGRDPARIRRRRVILGVIAIGTLGAAAAAFAVGRAYSQAAEPVCSGGEEQLARAWPLDAQQRDLAHIATLSPFGRDVADRLGRTLAAHRERWSAGVRDACLAHRRGEQSDALLDRRMACLDRARSGLAEVAELSRGATVDSLPGLAQAAAALPAPTLCSDVTALLADADPPRAGIAQKVAAIREDLERARVLIAAGRFEEGRTRAEAGLAAARPLAYPPLVAEASLVVGHAGMELGDRNAVLALGEATSTALANGMDALAIEAWARRAYSAAVDDPSQALAGREVIESLAERTHSPFARALLANNIGAIELGLGQRASARDHFERAIAEAAHVDGPGAVELVAARTNLATVTDEPAARDHLMVTARDDVARLLGPDHPETLLVEWYREMWTLASLPDAAAALRSTCARDELHAALSNRTALCLVELAEVDEALGRRDVATAELERAATLGAEKLAEVPETTGYLHLVHGDPAGARSAFQAALAAMPVATGEAWTATFARAKLQLGLARAQLAAHADASAMTAQVTAVLEDLVRTQHAAAIERQLTAVRQLTSAAAPSSSDTRGSTSR